ncbi:hypothetical protein, partial [Streptomyces sp. NPDC046182]|uniref:hypothetical protein n=1 Tax=Streptomyces sp. NPDC046182 TaxID=3154601 RepID=UPI0033C05ACD
GTLLSSQGTDASFVLTLSGFPPGFPSVFRVSNLTRSFSVPFPVRILFPVACWLPLPFGVFTTLAEFPGDS